MKQVTAWPAFICLATGWDHVEPGTLTVDGVTPFPGPALSQVEPLGIEPNNIFDDFDPGYARFLREVRGPRRFYGARVVAGEEWRIAAVSQQKTPACEHRLEVYAPYNLRADLALRTGDKVIVDAFDRTTWLGWQGRISTS